MKIEFLQDGSPQCPLIRLFDFTSDEMRQLHDAVLILAHDASPVAIHSLPFVQSINGCGLTLQTGRWDEGIVRPMNGEAFVCRMTEATSENTAGLLEPFIRHTDGHQWLVETPSEVQLLLSRTGKW